MFERLKEVLNRDLGFDVKLHWQDWALPLSLQWETGLPVNYAWVGIGPIHMLVVFGKYVKLEGRYTDDRWEDVK